ncbi:glycosyltransferase family 2 protein [Roseobacter sp. HKCCA0434]|uniref:glycosyltransferase family 2 protein n=1 Tax=Roseobacter sp. HKCCA0434 TaxID=3079297 RepID=UPI002905D787|nr:glycosyltransferase family 2 protein [Roseobacter sp. HKCCA0434]
MRAPIVSYWPGGRLDYIARAALISMRDTGARVTLFAHAPVPDLPPGVEIAAAGPLLDPAGLAPDARALIPDRMRWEVLAARPGAVFVSISTLVLGPLQPDAQGYLFGWEGPGHVGAEVVALPPGGPELAALRALAADPAPVPPWLDPDLRAGLEAAPEPVPAHHLPWGTFGATGLTEVLRTRGRLDLARGVEVFHPLPYAERSRLLRRRTKLADLVQPGSLALPLHRSESLRAAVTQLAGLPRYWCPLGEVLRGAGVNPRAHLPRGVVLARGDDRWAEEPDGTPVASPTTTPVAPAIAETPPAPPSGRRVGIVTCMKNEGPFILEWVAHHRAIGVTDITVYTNDCTDGTDALLDLLVETGHISARRDNPWRNSEDNKAGDPQRAALWHAQNQPDFAALDWVIPMDVDEFLSVHVGGGRLDDLFAALPGVDMISPLWRLFGNGFHRRFEDGFVTERMRLAAPPDMNKPFQAWGFKTLFRNDGAWEKMSVHRPRNLVEGRPPPVWVSGHGVAMPPEFLTRGWRALKHQAGYGLVSLNHYAVRDAESYLVKRDRGRVNHIDEDQGLAYWFRMNHNVEPEERLADKLGPTKAYHADMLADPRIAAAHAACVAAHRAKIAELHGRPDHAALHAAITGARLEGLSRLTPHFGNRLFEAGPGAVPQAVFDWIERNPDGDELPDTLDDPAPLPPEEAGADRLLPRGAGLRFPDMPPEHTPPRAPDPEPEDAPDTPEPDQPVAAGTAPSGDPIWLGENDIRAFDSLLARTQPRYPMLAAPDTPPPSDNVVVITAMKNEAPFILEWIAWHLTVGVRHFLVYTNDCTDQTDPMLDRLAQMGLVTHLPNPFNREAGQKPQRGALNDAIAQPVVRESDWYLVIDCDEFANVHVGDGTLQGMVAAMNHPDIVSLTWKLFGNGGVHAYEDRPVTEQFTACAPLYLPRPRLGWGFKSMARPSAPSGKIGVHRPLDLDTSGAVRWVNGSGRVMPDKSMGNSTWFSRKASIGYGMVTLNHYILRSAESFLVKRERGRINHVDQDQGLGYWSTRNYATETDTRAAEFMATRVAPKLAELKADPVLGALHADAVAWHRARIAHLRAQPDYAALYDAITDAGLRDAIYLAEAEEEGGEG